jgi:hypothetical protein
MIAGGVQAQGKVCPESTKFVNANVAQINSIFHSTHTSFTVASETA